MSCIETNSITAKIIGCSYTVSNTLGVGLVEKVYENALTHQIRKSGMRAAQQHPIRVSFDNVVVGEFFADLLVEDRVLVELKAVSFLTDEHMAQALNYLRATGLEICLLINFGVSKVQVKRLRPYTAWQAPRP